MPSRGYDWLEIERTYVEGRLSLSALGEKKRIPLNTLKKQSAQRGWAAKRRAYRCGRRDEAQDEAREADLLSMVTELVERSTADLLGRVADGSYQASAVDLERLMRVLAMLEDRAAQPPQRSQERDEDSPLARLAYEDPKAAIRLLAMGG